MKSIIFGICRVPQALKALAETAPLTGCGRGPSASLAAALVLVLSLSACGGQDTLAAQARSGDGKNYIAGDGSVTEYSTDRRSAPVDVNAVLLDGETIDSDDWQEKVTVLNFWYAACAPCRVEAPDLQALHAEMAPKGVQFYGVNIRDEPATAESFERSFSIGYPSVMDKDGSMLLGLSAYVPPTAVPTTLVIDKEGRVASRILGVAEKGTLKALIVSALAES